MPSINKLREKTMATNAYLAGVAIPFEYRPGAMATEYYDKLQESIDTGDLDKSTEALCYLLVSWDLTESTQKMIDLDILDPKKFKDGAMPEESPIPLEAEAMKKLDLPIPLFAAINSAIQEDISSGGKSTKKGR